MRRCGALPEDLSSEPLRGQAPRLRPRWRPPHHGAGRGGGGSRRVTPADHDGGDDNARGARRAPQGQGQGRDAEQIVAAAAAAEAGSDGRKLVGRKVCGLVFANRNLLLKHIEATGYITDPTRKTGVITGLYFIPPTEPVLAGEKGLRGPEEVEKPAQKEDSDSD